MADQVEARVADVTIRAATAQDAEDMATLINEIIAIGGTTAHRTPFTPQRIASHFIAPHRGICCHVATADGVLLGFQALEWCDPDWPAIEERLPSDWAIIGTFVCASGQGRGVGRKLLAETVRIARAAGVAAIDATIRRENKGGQAFYERM